MDSSPLPQEPPRLPRQLQGPAFPEDTGAVPPAVAAAVTSYAAGEGSRTAVLAALRESRLLVPVVAVLGESEVDAGGLTHDKSSDMAAVLLTGADGRLALLAFTGTDPLTSWDPQARPVPVPSVLAAQAAVQEGAAALLVDLAGPVTLVVEGEDLHRLALGWRPALVDGQPAWIGPAAGPHDQER